MNDDAHLVASGAPIAGADQPADLLAPTGDRDDDPTRCWRRQLRVESLVGRSNGMARLLADVDLVHGCSVPVLLLGEHGTGKSLVARAIHDSGPRAERPFVPINSAAIPEALLESELFGALPGSHSAARQRQVGRVEAARGGTLFLDEVAELSLGCQARLLQLLQEGLYFPLGASKPVVADVRIVSATNAALSRRVEEGAFRADLYYRLRGLEITVPPLRERREDLDVLARSLCRRLAVELGVLAREPSPVAMAALLLHDWPGNIRELEHTLRQGLLRAARERSAWIEPAHLAPANANLAVEEARSTWQGVTQQFQRSYLLQVLRQVDWNVCEAARRLELSRAHVYNLVREFGLVRPAAREVSAGECPPPRSPSTGAA